MKQVLIAMLVVVGIIGAAVVFGKEDVAEGVVSNNFYGNEQSEVTVIEYGDFECPACASFFPVISAIKEEYKDTVKFEFRHFPLVQIHPNAQAAHRAAQAAANQGSFWEMHDVLYGRVASWRSSGGTGHNGTPSTNPSPIFRDYAVELGLDMEQYDADVASSEVLGTINADVAQGKSEGVSGTPTIMINGEIVETVDVGSVSLFSAALDEALGINTEEPASDEEDTSSDAESTEAN